MKVQIDDGAYAPTRAHGTDAGMDLRAPADPWMIRLYEEHPDLARRLDQWCIDCAAAAGKEFVRDATVRYAGSISCAEMHKMLDLDEDTRKKLEELDEYILLLERERW